MKLKIKNRSKWLIWVLVVILLFTVLAVTCDHTLGYFREPQYPLLSVRINPPVNGKVIALQDSGIPGTQITLVVNPAPGFRLMDNGLLGITPSTSNYGIARYPPYRFTLNEDIVITATFEPVTGNDRSVYIQDNIQDGIITAYSVRKSASQGDILRWPSAPEGTEILLKVYPNPGFSLKPGTLKANGVNINEETLMFVLQNEDVVVTGEFETFNGALGYIESGKKALLRDDYDSAVTSFEKAYELDKTNHQAIFYSSLSRLASIAIDRDVQDLLDMIGFRRKAENLNNMLALGDAWGNYYKINPVTEQRDWFKLPGWLQQYCEVTLPAIDDHPTGYHAFQNQQSIIQGTKDSSGNYTMASWYILFFCNLMGTNVHDLNDVVDDTLQYVFGDTFEAAADRAASLPSNTSFDIEKAIAEKLLIGTVFEDGDSIGSAELDLLFSSLRLIKSSFEWVAAYDLEFDRYVFRLWSEVGGGNFIPLWYDMYDAMNAPYTNLLLGDGNGNMYDIINEATDFFLSNIFNFCIEYPATARRIPSMLPLRNHFLQPRSNAPAMMNKSRSDLLKSINTFIKVYDYYDAHIQIPQVIKDKFNNYKWVKGCLTSLKVAVESGGTFYYPKNKPTGDIWNPGTQYGINMDKFFTPGQLSINKLLVTESGTKRPKFYGWNVAQLSVAGKELSKLEDLSEYDRIGFKFDLKSLKEVFVGLEKDNRVLGNEEFVHILFPSMLFTQQNGKYLYTLYNDLYEFTNRGK